MSEKSNEYYVNLGNYLAAHLSKKTKSQLVVMLANAIVSHEIDKEVNRKFLGDLAGKTVEQGNKITMLEEVEKVAMRALRFNHDTISSLYAEKEARLEPLRKGAAITNAPHDEARSKVYAWLDSNYRPGHKHSDMAVLIEKEVAREYDTVLKDITNWKKLRGITRKR